jgi:hypothetical protein
MREIPMAKLACNKIYEDIDMPAVKGRCASGV